MIKEIISAVVLTVIFILLFIHVFAFRIFIYALLGIILIWVFFTFFIKKYTETERAIIYRFGKFNRVAGPGWSIVIPFFEKEYAVVDVRTKMINITIPLAFTKDDLRLSISGTYYYKIINPKKAILTVENYQKGLSDILISETRNTIAKLSMREVFANLDELNDIVKDSIRHETWKWGIDVDMVQIKEIVPPLEIAEAMQQKEIASQQLQAKRFLAEARKVVIEAIGEAASHLDDKSIMYLYLEALKELSKGKSTKMVFPMEFINVLEKMKEDVNTSLAGMNIVGAINAVKDKILDAKKD